MNQFTIAQSQMSYADRILLTKTDVAGDSEKLRERLARINPSLARFTPWYGDDDLSRLFYASGFMLEGSVLASQPRFHFVPINGNIVVELLVGAVTRWISARGFAGDGKPAAGISG